IINAAEYGMPQRRRRVFFIGYHKSTAIYKKIQETKMDWIQKRGVLASAFPIHEMPSESKFILNGDLVELTQNFGKGAKKSRFDNTGLQIDGKVFTAKSKPRYEGVKAVLEEVLVDTEIPSEFYIDESDKAKWSYLKGAKNIERETAGGFVYKYSEGGMIYPDALDNASRTIITGEGGKTPSRFKHVIDTDKGLRRLVPVELERLNMFPDNHTKLEGITDAKRAFFMGNALVVGVIEKLSDELFARISD
ncbi:DNA cytosine methyltransferase, partial [Hellea sp.]|nr:DNA cytosine methyltransferase [Hellea sp.]